MKKLFFLIFIFGGLFPPKIHAQEKSLEQLPAKERDSILMAVAKEAILICGPDYYRDHELPEISIIWAWEGDDKNKGRKYYSLRYPQNEKKEKLRNKNAATVYLWADSLDVFTIFFGNGAIYDLDSIDYRHAKIKKNPYQQAKDMKPIVRYAFPPTNFNHPYHELNRDSLLVDFSQKLIKRHCPDYYKNYQKPKIETKQFTGEGNDNGKLYFRLTYPPHKERETLNRNYSVIIEIWEEGHIRRFLFDNGLEINTLPDIMTWSINTKEYRGFSSGAFSVPLVKENVKLKPSRKTIDLDKLPNKTRDSMLIKQGKEILLVIGPTYQRGFQRPITDTVTRIDVGGGQSRPYYQNLSGPRVKEGYQEQNEQHPGRKFYEVQFLGGAAELTHTKSKIAMIKFWANTGDPFSITLGNGVVVYFDGLDYKKIKVNVPYEDLNTVGALKQKK